jgi:hypothetical protein
LFALRYILGMRTRRNAVALAVAALTVLGLAGCVPPSPHVIPTSEPSSAPVFASNAAALAAAKKAYIAYLTVSDQILVDGGKNPQRLLAVATSSELKRQLPGFSEEASKNWRSTGGTVIDEIQLQSLDSNAPGGHGIVTVYACIDVSNVDVLDQSGKSVVSPDRPKTSTFQAVFDLSNRASSHLIMANESPWQGAGICPT